ncbi:DUF1376 domain-containing protein [Methylobacterium sp. ID0610]|uniref:DUF1376 domain-containing protein n=1 Tax=Methylobacterium carpenticola TaxID=3344827 RepID=UPI00369FC246
MSTPSDLPAPLVPPDTDIGGLSAFLLDVERLFASELWALSTGEEFKAAVALWGRAWQQVPAGSLPNDERLLAAFSGAGARWKKVREVALRGFVLCSDGRLYHRVLCADVMRAAKTREDRRMRTAAATKARLARVDHDDDPPSGGKKLNGINKTGPRDVDRYEERDEQRDEPRHGVRHEQRDGLQMATSRGSLRSPIAGHSSTEKNLQAAACDPVPPTEPPPAAPPAASTVRECDTAAGFDRIAARCREILPSTWPLAVEADARPVVQLVRDGLDLEAEIVPALREIACRRTPIRTWPIVANAVAERVQAQRDARAASGLNPKPPAPPKPEDLIDLGSPYGAYGEAVLRVFVEKHRSDPTAWIEHLVGPPPGQPGCRIPARLLISEAA